MATTSFLKWGRDWPPHYYCMIRQFYYSIFNTLRCILLVSGQDMSISYPRRKDGDGRNFLFQNENGIGHHLILRFEMATTSLSNEKGVNHHVFLRWQDDYIIILSHYYIGVPGRRHVNIPPFKVRWTWPPIPKVRTGLATTWLFDYWVIILLHSYITIFSYCYMIILRGCYINLPPFRVRWRWPPTPF